VTIGRRVPPMAVDSIGGGSWRAHVYPDESFWPATWPALERLKFLSGDRKTLVKFEGLARYGQGVFARSTELADHGYGPVVRDAGDGFFGYEVIDGRPLAREDLSYGLLLRMAKYCAARSAAFPVSTLRSEELTQMLDVNLNHELPGRAVQVPELETVRPTVVDARMMPHEWIVGRNGMVKKTDGASHGDDHLFPGPVDIAWDLAGVVVEWCLRPAATDFFLAAYRRASGDAADRRLPAYVFAYTLFRLAYCKLAAQALGGTSEGPRLISAYRRYRALLDLQIALGKRPLEPALDAR
jgi:hypothetical protein